MPYLELFSDILLELDAKRSPHSLVQSSRYKLKFVNRSLRSYQDIERNMLDYLKSNLTAVEYDSVVARIKDYNIESCICELILELIRYIESKLDILLEHLEDVLNVVNQIKALDSGHNELKENLLVHCSLMAYDSFAALRTMRKQVVALAKTYHVPMYYDTEERCNRIRPALLTTYKNILVMMDDFGTLSEALFIIRNSEDEKTAAQPVPQSSAKQLPTHKSTSAPKQDLTQPMASGAAASGEQFEQMPNLAFRIGSPISTSS